MFIMDQGKNFLFYCVIVKIMLFKDLDYHVYALFDNKKLKLSCGIRALIVNSDFPLMVYYAFMSTAFFSFKLFCVLP